MRNFFVVSAYIVSTLLLSSVVVTIAHADSDYSAGMKAYMSGDFDAAAGFWLKSSQNKNARAMFNLGLLHERGKLRNANAQRAEQWFRESGKAGYAAADYHLAHKLKVAGNADEAEQLLKRAANAGHVLAQEELGGSFNRPATQPKKYLATRANPAQENQKPLASEKPLAKQKPLANEKPVATQKPINKQPAQQRRYLGEQWIKVQPESAWTIQMLAFSDEAKVRNFIDQHSLHRHAAYFAEGDQAAPVYKLIYGVYDSKQEADAARASFTAVLKEHGPWLRPIKGVQAIVDNR